MANRRYIEEEWYTSNRTVYRKAYYFRVLGCSLCPPNRGENWNRVPRHDRYKSARKGRCSGPIEPPARYFEDGSPVPKSLKRLRRSDKPQFKYGVWWEPYYKRGNE